MYYLKAQNSLYKLVILNFMNSSFKNFLFAFEFNKLIFLEEKQHFNKIYFIFKKLIKPFLRGHLGLSNGISPSRIGGFLIELWPKEYPRVLNR
jgi:hypothetical protein